MNLTSFLVVVVVVCVGMEGGTVGEEREMGEGRSNKEVSRTLLSETLPTKLLQLNNITSASLSFVLPYGLFFSLLFSFF